MNAAAEKLLNALDKATGAPKPVTPRVAAAKALEKFNRGPIAKAERAKILALKPDHDNCERAFLHDFTDTKVYESLNKQREDNAAAAREGRLHEVEIKSHAVLYAEYETRRAIALHALERVCAELWALAQEVHRQFAEVGEQFIAANTGADDENFGLPADEKPIVVAVRDLVKLCRSRQAQKVSGTPQLSSMISFITL